MLWFGRFDKFILLAIFYILIYFNFKLLVPLLPDKKAIHKTIKSIRPEIRITVSLDKDRSNKPRANKIEEKVEIKPVLVFYNHVPLCESSVIFNILESLKFKNSFVVKNDIAPEMKVSVLFYDSYKSYFLSIIWPMKRKKLSSYKTWLVTAYRWFIFDTYTSWILICQSTSI